MSGGPAGRFRGMSRQGEANGSSSGGGPFASVLGERVSRRSVASADRYHLTRGWDSAELAHQVEVVVAAPVLDDPAVGDTHDVHTPHLDLATGGRDAEEISAVGAAHRCAG